MKDAVSRNWKNAVTEVAASLIGTLGIVFVISGVLAQQNPTASLSSTFMSYFSGGQIGLAVLSLSGVVFIAVLRHGTMGRLTSVFLYIILFLPVIAAAFIVALNPGFQQGGLTEPNLRTLWWVYCGLHGLWFLILLLEPVVPSAEEAGKEEDNRVKQIKMRAAGRG
ncbi:MAG: hypothetical protein IH622_20555 [Ochrobactrum anthropi]|uniref:Uncharacterized protein n=1 Tax=Brucella anthropi TaxID=529 RepID=A0A8I0TAI7_BRUAN|nr:hypothetical protein [Brucella anthropi]MBE0563187.1 hypothetical protein [Brucella anthropi]